ncbi:hypothetical protein ACOSQ4_017206 [Xanthoceras sorbifolium]
MFSQHLTAFAAAPPILAVASTNSQPGICLSFSLNVIFPSSHVWIADSGATRHICSQAQVFISLKAITHTNVTLPNQTKIPVIFGGDVRLSSDLVLKDVLYVPQF